MTTTPDTEESIVRQNLMERKGYAPYCCECRSMARTEWSEEKEQFVCRSCGWQSSFEAEFIARYKTKWGLNNTPDTSRERAEFLISDLNNHDDLDMLIAEFIRALLTERDEAVARRNDTASTMRALIHAKEQAIARAEAAEKERDELKQMLHDIDGKPSP